MGPSGVQRYSRERGRSFEDLVARVGAEAPRHVVDLGCGPGDRTATLLERWPTATVTGIDSSAEMVQVAQALAVPGRLSFVEADLGQWRPRQAVDVVVSNSTLQWVPDHLHLLPCLVDTLAPEGWLAFQVPDNFGEPSHVVLAELRQGRRWRDKVGAGADRPAVHRPETYLTALADLGLLVDAWQTTYLHVLPGQDAVLEWTKGTAMRPILAALDDAERVEFLDEYAAGLRSAYPQRAYGTVLPFRRIFVVAHRIAG